MSEQNCIDLRDAILDGGQAHLGRSVDQKRSAGAGDISSAPAATIAWIRTCAGLARAPDLWHANRRTRSEKSYAKTCTHSKTPSLFLGHLAGREILLDFLKRATLRFGKEECRGDEVNYSKACEHEEHRTVVVRCGAPLREHRSDASGDALVDDHRNRHTVGANTGGHKLGKSKPHANARTDSVEADEHEEEDCRENTSDHRRRDPRLRNGEEDCADTAKADDNSARAKLKKELTAFLVNERASDNCHDAVHDLDGNVGDVGERALHTSLLEDRHRIVKNGVDARRLVASENHNSENERNNILLLEERVGSGSILRLFSGGSLIGSNHLGENFLCLLFAVVSGERSKSFFLATLLVEPARRFLELERTKEEDDARNAGEEEDHLPCANP